MNIVIEEIVLNPLIQIEETVQEISIPISEMQMPGKSAYQSALDGGFVGTELEFNESLANQINFSQVNTYALMLSITVSSKLKIVKVLSDENKGIENTIYHIYPDGVRMWIASVQDN
jgi:hypothetical protein